MSDLSIDDFKVFLPAKHVATAAGFYKALGWKPLYETEAVAELELGGFRFIMHSNAEAAEGFMAHVRVADADAWAAHAGRVIASGDFAGARVEGPRDEAWGYRVAYVWDPSGVLLPFSQPLPRRA
jgi:catechol 2,3-dioxygenase-like lactoylglutathione lyase family enzyme